MSETLLIAEKSSIATFAKRQLIRIEKSKIARVSFCSACCQNLKSRVRIYARIFALVRLICVHATWRARALASYWLIMAFVAWFLKIK